MTILVTRLQESIFELLMIEHSDFKIGIFIETLVIPCNRLYNSYKNFVSLLFDSLVFITPVLPKSHEQTRSAMRYHRRLLTMPT